MPRNLLTVAVAEGSKAVVPMMASKAIVASGGQLEADTGLEVSTTRRALNNRKSSQQ
jgi:hypothetical protein